jgi:hypothetical protein
LSVPESNLGPDIELTPDAWGRFERAVDRVSKSSPQHRAAKNTREPDAIYLFKELDLLLKQKGCPVQLADSVLKVIDRLQSCFSFEIRCAHGTDKAIMYAQPTDLFVRFVAAVRARDLPLVEVIEHELTS